VARRCRNGLRRFAGQRDDSGGDPGDEHLYFTTREQPCDNQVTVIINLTPRVNYALTN